MIIVNSRGAEEYLDRLIVNLASLSQLPTITVTKASESANTTTSSVPILMTVPKTPQDSLTPTPSEQRNHNAQAKILLIFNTNELAGLGIETDGTIATQPEMT